jgi:hypothetical protein
MEQITKFDLTVDERRGSSRTIILIPPQRDAWTCLVQQYSASVFELRLVCAVRLSQNTTVSRGVKRQLWQECLRNTLHPNVMEFVKQIKS